MQRLVASPYGLRQLVRKLIIKSSSTTDSRFIIVLLVAHEAYGNGDVSNICDVLADSLIKRGKCAAMTRLMDDCQLDLAGFQGVPRTDGAIVQHP